MAKKGALCGIGISLLFVSAVARGQLPDFHPTDAHVNGLAVGGQIAEVVYSLENRGDGPVLAGDYFHDFVYLSSNATWDASAQYLFSMGGSDGLTAGQSFDRTNAVVLPVVQSGNYYLIVRANMIQWSGYSVAESDKRNNDVAFPVRVVVPDLHPTDAHVNGLAVGGQTAEVVYSLENRGDGPVQAGYYFHDFVYLSSNATWDASAQYLFSMGGSDGLAAGQSYDRTNAAVLPVVQPGNYYLIVRANNPNWQGQSVGEFDKSNNDVAFPVRVVVPDLHPTDAHVNGLAVGGQTAEVIYSVENRGDGPVQAGYYFHDFVYLSSNATWDAGAQYLFSMGGSDGLTAGQSYTRTNAAVLPVVQPGSYYLIVRTDVGNRIGEPDEDNNDVAFTLSSRVTLGVRSYQSSVELFWPITIDPYTLTTTTNLNGSWNPILAPVLNSDGVNTVTVPTINSASFFRLQK